MERRGWLGWDVQEAPARHRGAAARGPPAGATWNRCASTARPPAPLDADTPVVPASWEAGLRAAGGACALVDALLDGTAPTGFCGTRPPGHHAEPDRAMGFCLFANVAVAAEHALARDGVERVFILDWDVHHGNGTNAAFHSRPRRPVLQPAPVPVLSRHRRAGRHRLGRRERGSRSTCPVPAGSGDAGVAGAGRARGHARRARVRARPDPGLGRLRRPPRRPAGRVQPGDRQLPPAGPARRDAGGRRWACPRARSWRAATTWTRWPSRPWPRWRRWRRAATPRPVERGPLVEAAGGRRSTAWVNAPGYLRFSRSVAWSALPRSS